MKINKKIIIYIQIIVIIKVSNLLKLNCVIKQLYTVYIYLFLIVFSFLITLTKFTDTTDNNIIAFQYPKLCLLLFHKILFFM